MNVVADAGGLDHAAVGRQLAVEDGEAPVLRVGGVLRADAVLRVEHERRVVGHEAGGLGLFKHRRPVFVVGLVDLPAAQPAGAHQAADLLFLALGVLPDDQQRRPFQLPQLGAHHSL